MCVIYCTFSYLIAAIQATPSSLTSSGQGHLNSMGSIQVHMDSIIKDIEHFKKFQKEQESRIEEVIFLYEQTTKNIETLADRSGGDLPAGVLDHVAEMIQVSLKKSVRDLVYTYQFDLPNTLIEIRVQGSFATTRSKLTTSFNPRKYS